MRGFVKPLIPLNAAKLHIFRESCKYFACFSQLFFIYSTDLLPNSGKKAVISPHVWLMSPCQNGCRRGR